MNIIADLYYKYGEDIATTPEAKEAEDALFGFFEKYMLGDEVFYEKEARLELEELICLHEASSEKQGWIRGCKFGVQMMMSANGGVGA